VPDSQRKSLTREGIAGAALAVIDREGLPALSMRRIGTELGVEGMALYRHFPQKDAILDAVVDLVVGRIVYRHAGDRRTSLRLLSLDLRAKVLAHPNALPLVAARWLQTDALRAVLAEASADLASTGVEVHALLHALMSFLLGYCWLEVGAFVGPMPDEGGLTRKPVRPKEPAPGEGDDRAASGSPQFERELEFLLAGALGPAPAL